MIIRYYNFRFQTFLSFLKSYQNWNEASGFDYLDSSSALRVAGHSANYKILLSSVV